MKTKVFLIAISVMFMGISCQDQEMLDKLAKLESQIKLEEQNKLTAERFHKDLSIDRNWEVAEEILAADVIIHGQGADDTKGIEAVKGYDEIYKNLVNAEINHYEIIAEGDYVFIRWDLTFDHTKDLMGIPASGNRVSGITGMDLFRMQDGKIAEMWQNWDQVGFLQQMGAFPSE